jgi:DNA-binding CsgD family transcriptional regulator
MVTEATYSLWQRLAAFPAAESDHALRYLKEWLARELAADNVTWIGAVRALRGAAANDDAFFGWRLRARRPLRPDSASYQQLLKNYYDPHHYGKRTPSYYACAQGDKTDHVGIAERASLAGAGRFRVHRLRDGSIDFAAFRRTPHYRLYYRDHGIVDRMTIAFPVSADAESFLLLDRQDVDGKGRRPFTARDAALAGGAVRGAPELHRRMFLGHGLVASDKLLSPTERRVLHLLLTSRSEKQIAAATGQSCATLHKYVVALYKRFRVSGRAGLVSQWLGGSLEAPA